MQFVTVWHTFLVKPKFETSKSKEPHHEAAGTAQRVFFYQPLKGIDAIHL